MKTKWRYELYQAAISVMALVVCSVAGVAQAGPLMPVYSEGDDTSRAAAPPRSIYKEFPGSRLEIPNMPVVKNQGGVPSCRAFSIAAILQKYTCDKWNISHCEKLDQEVAISYFGLSIYTNEDSKIKRTYQPNQLFSQGINMYQILENISVRGGKLILNSCRPFDDMATRLSTPEKYQNFFSHLKGMFAAERSSSRGKDEGHSLVTDLNEKSGLNLTQPDLERALSKLSYDEFLYSLFFDGCKTELFPSSFTIMAYPIDILDVSPSDVKNKIIEGLRKGKPVLFPAFCLRRLADGSCDGSHSAVIVGYKKVFNPRNKADVKEVFKIHNSWGMEWQNTNNGGWVDADILVANTGLSRVNGKTRIGSSSVIWLE